MNRILTAALCVGLFGLIALHAEERASSNKKDLTDKLDPKKLVGTYTITSGQRDGKEIPEKNFKGAVVTFTKDRIFGHDKDKKEFFGADYTLDTSKKPAVIKMTSTAPKKGEKSDGIIEVAADVVKICYALPGGKTPTSFKAGEKQHLMVLKRKSDANR